MPRRVALLRKLISHADGSDIRNAQFQFNPLRSQNETRGAPSRIKNVGRKSLSFADYCSGSQKDCDKIFNRHHLLLMA